MLEIFQISIMLLVSLTGMTAAIAEGMPIAALTLPIALATWYFVDRRQLIAVPGWIAGVLGGVAFVAAGVEYLLLPARSYLIVGNHLLAYLTWIQLVQKKDARVYWALFALSVLQIAVTSLLTFSLWFGLSLLAYALLATWTLSIFLLYRSVQSLGGEQGRSVVSRRPQNGNSSGTRAWSSVSRDQDDQLVTGRYCGSTVSVTGLGMLMALLFFMFIPRIWSSPRTVQGGAPGAPLTGFSTEVRLGDMGEILESAEVVMEVRLFHSQDGTMLSVRESEKLLGAEPLFRGAVLEEYRNGRWHRPQQKSSRRVEEGISQAPYRMRIDLAPLNAETIFSFGNTLGAATVKSYGTITWDYFSNELNRGEETDLDRDFSYDLYFEAGPPDEWLSRRRLLELSVGSRFDVQRRTVAPMSFRKFQYNLASLQQLPRELQPLYKITDRVVGGSASAREKAEKIQQWLQTSGEFRYSMKLSVSNSSIDPILDFLQNRKSGHCEYFASAMATMLRCAGIPSRVITGFKGGSFNSRSGTLTVQQFHAHAWVEAYLDGRWVTFDPTPPERDEAVVGIEASPSGITRMWRRAESVWHRMGMLSRDGQEERVYRPLRQRFLQGAQMVQDLLQGRTESLKRIFEFFTTPERWFSVEGGIVALLIVLLIGAVSWLIRRLYQASRSIGKYLKAQVTGGGRTMRVPFYERLLSLLKLHGLVPRPTQTALEFIHSVLPVLQPKLAAQGMDAWPEEVVDQFYRVRYGREALNPEEARQLEQRLSELEICLQSAAEAKS